PTATPNSYILVSSELGKASPGSKAPNMLREFGAAHSTSPLSVRAEAGAMSVDLQDRRNSRITVNTVLHRII
ncbi:MAG: hypothetical protein ACI8RZ_001424, partial [Myxococcota bacterium]